MKKISVAFDGLKFSKSSLDYAIELALRGKALLTGVFLEDYLYHSFNLFDMVGSQGVLGTKLSSLLKQDQATRDASVALFKKTCAARSVSYMVHEDKHFAIDDLLKESIFSDLTIIGTGETLNHFKQDRPTPFVKEMLAGAQSPVLVVPSVHHPVDRVVILYDGHPSSVFAFKMFTYLFPWALKFPAEVVYVDNRDLALFPDGNLIGEYASCYYDQPKMTQLSGEPSEILVNHLKNLPPGTLVVMGAYSRGSVSRLFNESMANKLMEAVDLPLFIAHSK